MKIDLSCPAEVWRTELPREDYPACDLVLYNLSDKLIISVEVTMLFNTPDGDDPIRMIYRAHDLQGRSESTFTASVPVAQEVKGRTAEVIIEKVWFDDNSIWRRDRYPLTEYEPNALPNSRSLEHLRYIAGPTAVGYPEEQDAVWLCVCGRPNELSAPRCVRCHRHREQVFADFSRDAIETAVARREQQLSLQAKAAREDASRLQLQREQEHNKRRRRQRRIAAIVGSAAALLLVAYGTVFHLLPYLSYQQAVSQLENGDAAAAQPVFAGMPGYLDADEYLRRCQYLTAKDDLDANTPERLAHAREVFVALGAYEDAPDLVMEADYRSAALLASSGKPAEARALYVSLGEYRDSPSQILYCDYLSACALLDSGDYAAAYEAFLALGEYEDAPDLALMALYLPGKEALEAGDPDTALPYLVQLTGYRDADTLLCQAHYLRGVAFRDAEEPDPVAAGEAFLLAGDYEDAPAQAVLCLYPAAVAAMDRGDYETAMALFALIPDYEDAADRYHACVYALAARAMKDTEYTRARELLALLPDTYEDVLVLRQDCIYLPAVASYKRGDYAAAAAGFSQIPTYRDSELQYKRSCYAWAKQLADRGDYASAAALYEQLGDYSDSVGNLRRVRYSLAQLRLAEQDYPGALALLTLLGDYKESEKLYQQAAYGQACALLEAGNDEEARPLFVALGKYMDAAEKVAACDYARAARLAEEGKTEEAALLYMTISGYEDAAAQAGKLYCRLAAQAAAQGQTLVAARYYTAAGAYEDAPALAEAAYDAYYQATAEQVAAAMDTGDYAFAAALLSHTDLTDLPEKYAHLSDLYLEANYQAGLQLFNAGKPYEALVYYQAVPGYRSTDEFLQRSCYLILGEWVDAEGTRYLFRNDGTCSMDGVELYFHVDNAYALHTGESQADLSLTHKITHITQEDFTLRDIRGGQSRTIRLTRVPAEDAPDAEPDTGYEVVDDE